MFTLHDLLALFTPDIGTARGDCGSATMPDGGTAEYTTSSTHDAYTLIRRVCMVH